MSDKKESKPSVEQQRPKTCVGELCWNPKTGRLEFEFDRKGCPREVLRHLEAQTPMTVRMKAPIVEDSEQKP